MSSQTDGIDLDQYKKQAKELLRSLIAGEPEAQERFKAGHPKPKDVPKLADAQLVIAREHGHESWPSFQAYLLFRQAVRALDTGNEEALAKLITEDPGVLKYHCRRGEWYEAGYFKGAMLLHRVAGNPIRGPLPKNIVALTRILLDQGADPNGESDDGGKTIGLLLSSRQSSEAGTAMPIIEMLREAGANADLGAKALNAALTNGARETAEAMIRKGVQMDLRHAAALGRISDLREFLQSESRIEALEAALVFASFWDQNEAARLLVRHGARGDVLVRPGMHAPQTALHNAAWRGNREMVETLIEAGADPTVRDGNWDGTPADWARNGGHHELAEFLEGRMQSS